MSESGEAMTALAQFSWRESMDEGVRWEMPANITEIPTPWFLLRPSKVGADMFDQVKKTWSNSRTVKEAVSCDPDLSADNPMFEDLTQTGWDAWYLKHVTP